MIPESNLPPEESLRERLEANPADWNARLRIACLLYDREHFAEASALIWEADRIPCRALDLASAACILAKDQPGKAIRLLTAVLENNRGMAAQNMGMAHALLHHGMVLQSARFYGAALEMNPELVNLEFEHFFIWADDEQLLWGDFEGRRSPLHELPWMTRDPAEASELTRDVGRHTTPIAVPRVHQVKTGLSATQALREKLTENPGDWDTRRTLAQLLHDHGTYGEAAALIWESDPIPSTDLDIAFAARVLARGTPRNAIRLLTAVFEQNRGKAVQNMAIADALLHHGLVVESARFYGAALDADPSLVNPDLEHFLLWTDDANSLWENFLKIRPPLGIFPWAQSDPTLDFGADFPTPPILLSELKQVQGENLTDHLYQQLAGRNARISPPPAATFPADRAALNRRDSGEPDGQEAVAGAEQEEQATAAAKRLAEEQAAAEAKAASLFAEAEESARALIEQARQEATTEVAAIRAKAQEELQAALEQARQNTEQEMAALRAKAREEAEAAADAARKEAEIQAALIRAKAEEAAAQAEAASKLRAEEYARAIALAKQRAEEEERSIATAKRLAEEQANAAADQAAAAKAAAEQARQEATSEVAAMRAKAEEELKASLDQARQNSEQELEALRAKARETAESEAALIRTKAEEEARLAEKVRLEATAQAEAAAKLLAEENARALALAKQRADEEERSFAVTKRLAEEQAKAAAAKIREEATAEVSALRAKAQEELKASIETARRNTEKEMAAIRAKAEEEAKKATAAAEQAQLEAAAKAKAAAEILARAEEEAQAAAAQKARLEALAELAAIKAQAQEELKAAAEQAPLNSEQELKMLRAKAREESKRLMENALKEATSEVALPVSEENAMLESSTTEQAPAEDRASAAAPSPIPVAGTLAKTTGKASNREQGSYGKRRFGVLLVSAAIAMGCWKFLPGSAADRALFSTVAGSFANPPLFVSGNGTHESPWKLNSMTAVPKPDKREAPVVVSLGDDIANFFQSSPPAPIDLAVIFSNFHRLGARKAATAAVLAWEAPDPIGLAALDKALGKFDSLVMAAPLSRGAVASAMPAAFRRASLPLTKVAGDPSALPAVNRIPLPGVIFGGETAVAGFSTVESEPSAGLPPLMARWEDRVVFAFPLLTVLQRNNFPLDGVEIRLGEYIKLSPSGPVVPLDDYGRLAMPVKTMAPFKEISAEALIDGGDGLFPKTAPDPVILRDDQSAAEPATRAFSKKLSAMVAVIASDEGFARITAYPRLTLNCEFAVFTVLIIVLTALSGLADFSRHVAFAALAGVVLSAQWIGAGIASVWLPLLPSLAAVAAAAAVSQMTRASSPAPAAGAIGDPLEIEVRPEPETPVETPPTPEPPPKKPGASKKAHAEKPAKKPAEKKPPAKKAATPRKPRSKKRRTDP